MKRLALLVLSLLLVSSQAAAKSDRSLILGFLRAVDKGQDLTTVYPGAISASDSEKLRKFADCGWDHPIRWKKDEYFIIFVCSRKNMIGSTLTFSDGRIIKVSTYPVEATWSKDRYD